jgi:hypothetical protein
VRLVQASLEPLLLLGLRQVEQHLDDRGALVGEQALEAGDVVVAPLPPRLRHEALHPHGEHVLVVAAVEHPELAVGGHVGVHPPEVVAGPLLLRRCLEGRHPQADGVHGADDVLQDPALARRVEALDDEQHLALPFREEDLLELGEPLGERLERGVRGVLVTRGRGRVARGELREVDTAVRFDPVQRSAVGHPRSLRAGQPP